MAFRGTFDYSLDAKNRLTLPAKFRGELGERVVLARGTAQCVTVWRSDDFDAYIEQALANVHPMSPQADQINRWFVGPSHEVDIDSAGRVAVPPRLLQYAGMTKEVVVTGVGARLEVWDKDLYAAQDAAMDINALTASFNNVA